MAVQPPSSSSSASRSGSGAPSQAHVGVPVLLPIGRHQGKPPIVLNRPIFVVGSHSRARIHLISQSVSKHHALVVQTRHQTFVRDLASRTHTFVNGVQVREQVLKDGDELKIGSFTFRYRGAKASTVPEVPAPPAKLDVAGGEMPLPIEDRVILI